MRPVRCEHQPGKGELRCQLRSSSSKEIVINLAPHGNVISGLAAGFVLLGTIDGSREGALPSPDSLPPCISQPSLKLLPPQVQLSLPGASSGSPGLQRPLASAAVCPSSHSPLLQLPQDSAFVLMESRAPPGPVTFPQRVPASCLPQNERRFLKSILRLQNSSSVLPSPPRPALPGDPRPCPN